VGAARHPPLFPESRSGGRSKAKLKLGSLQVVMQFIFLGASPLRARRPGRLGGREREALMQKTGSARYAAVDLGESDCEEKGGAALVSDSPAPEWRGRVG